MSGGLGKKVCVIGAGGLGLAALKNLLETGFDVTVFERASYISGLWHATTDPDQTSVLPESRAVLTKYSVAYTDFSMSEESDRFPTAAQMCEYVEAYAKHFDLHRHIRLNTTVVRVLRDETDSKWLIEVRPTDSHGVPTETLGFDRLVFATGIHLKLNWPDIKGRHRFAGEIIHGLRMKEPSKYKGKRVLIIGLALTGTDCARHLAREGAEQVYCSHRRQVLLIPRVVEGKPLAPPMRSKLFNGRIEALAPAIARAMAKRFLQSIQEKSYPEMRDHPILNRAARKDVDVDTRIPVYADNLVPLLKTGQVESVHAVDEIIGAHSVRLADGTVLDNIDAVICATGATTDASALLPPQCDPANPDLAPDGFALIPETYRKQRPVLRLYQNWLSLQYSHSLAILGYAVRIQGSFPLGDVVSSAMAQLWSGGYPMPSQAEMERNVDAHYRHVAELLKHGDVMFPGRIPGLEWEHWHDKVAGAGIYDRLGNWWSWESWKLWWTDPELYKLLMDGTSSPHLFRLFETGKGRKRWDGARAAIEKANRAEEETIEKWKRQQAEKAKYGKSNKHAKT